MLAPIPGFVPVKTHHCVTGSMRNIYLFHNSPVSEELLLGLGSGLGFVYWHMKGTVPFLGGRANVGRPGEEGMEKTAGLRTGVTVELCQTGSARAAERSLLETLAAGEPMMIQVDMGFLPYFDFPEEFHFGGHVVIVAGYDAVEKQVLVADRDGELHPVTLEALARARGSHFKPFPPRNGWFRFAFRDHRSPKAEEVKEAIREVSTAMMEPPIGNLGVKGICTAAERVQKWPGVLDEAQLRQACLNVFIFVDATGGTGGGLFRYMYGRFLEEAAQITGQSLFAKVGQEMRAIGDSWQELAGIMKSASSSPSPAELLPEASRLLLDLAMKEEGLWKRLQ